MPRYAAATDASTAELRDARLIIAREVGFPTWRELVASAERSQRDDAERQEKWRRLRPEAEALLAGDTARLAQLTAGQADILLQMLAGREILGTRPGQELGAPRAAVDVLIGKATSLDLPLDQAVRADRWSTCACCSTPRRPRHPDRRHHPAGERHLLWPPADDRPARRARDRPGRRLWTYAACGRLDLVQACFDADGRLRPDAALSRPNTASFYPIPPRKPVSDDPEQIMAEAFVYACQHGRTEVVRWFLDRGLNPDAAPFFGRTALLWAVMCQQPEVVRLLIERGADPSRRERAYPLRRRGPGGRALRHRPARPRDPATPRAAQASIR